MRNVRSTNTSPEVALRNALKAAGVLVSDTVGKYLPGKPDIIIPAEHIAIFVDGDFWHGGQWRKRKFASLEEQFKEAPSRDYWIKKIRRNVNRDFSNTKVLLELGWKVIRFWESRIKKDLGGCIKTVVEASKKKKKSDILSIIPGRTFTEFSKTPKMIHAGLVKNGWAATHASERESDPIPAVTLAAASFTRNDLTSISRKNGPHEKDLSQVNCFIAELDEMKKRRPPILLLEIPASILSLRKGDAFCQALLELNGLGYTVDSFAIETSPPGEKSRKCFFVIAILESCIPAGEIKEQSCIYDDPVRPKALSEFIAKHPNINWNVRPLPVPVDCGTSDSGRTGKHSPVEWIAEYYLNPLVNELMKGRPLAPYSD
jgi:DNA mismatch endonuclease, patch repair protein